MNIPLTTKPSGYVFYLLSGGLTAVAAGFAYIGSQASRELLAIGAASGACALLAIVFFYLGYAVNHVTINVSADGLAVRGPFYGRVLTKSQLKLDEAKLVVLEGSFKPISRQNGIGLPDLKFGWFKLKNGEKAAALLGSGSTAVYIPTTEGYPLLLSPINREDFLAALRSI